MKLEVDLADDSISVDGVKVRFSFLKMLSDPNDAILYRFMLRDGEAVAETYALKDIQELVR